MSTVPPSVILVLTDDQGYGDLACHGNPVALTPHLDRLHAESVRFGDFHAAPMCTPTRGQLLTGMDAARKRVAHRPRAPACRRAKPRPACCTRRQGRGVHRASEGRTRPCAHLVR